MLQLIPVLSMLFLITSAAGSALWVADIEREKQRQADAISAQVDGVAVNDEFPPEYTDIEEGV